MNDPYLMAMAKKYIWWEAPKDAVEFPDRVIAQVMNLGDWPDVQQLVSHAGEPRLPAVVTHAEAGWFTARSWHYWHYRLGLSDIDHAPPKLPETRIS